MTDAPRTPRSLEDVVAEIVDALEPCAVEQIAVVDAVGRVLAAPVHAPGDLPPVSRSAMDGIAVRAADTANAGTDGVRLLLDGASLAGHAEGGPLAPGHARVISTGATLPRGADAVVRVEELHEEGDRVVLARAVDPGRDVRPAGEDATAGTVLVRAGARLGPATVGGLAGAGVREVHVRSRVRVGIVPTGDEVVAGSTPDAVSPMLAPILERVGGDVEVTGACPDDVDAISAAVQALAETCDVVVTVGGVSVGPRDHGHVVVEQFGQGRWELLALRPGRRFAWARRDGATLLCLPGSPLAALAVAVRVVLPVVATLSGAREAADGVLVPAGTPLQSSEGAERMVAVRWRAGTVHPVEGNGASDLARLARTQGLVRVAADVDVEAGEHVLVWDLR